jgi:arylsulfatase A-like enzyme
MEFAKELVLYEKLGAGPTTDLLVISLSANDILGHQVGPDSPEMKGMALELDRSLAEFIDFLGHQIGMANVWMALSADHGIAPLPEFAKTLRLPAANLDSKALHEQIDSLLSKKYAKKADYLRDLDYPVAWLNEEAFVGTPGGKDESVGEADVGEAMKQVGFAEYFTKSRLARGEIPPTEIGRRYAHSYSPEGGWYVMGIPRPFQVGTMKGTDHATPFSYDTHVPLAFYGLAFQPGIYRTHAEPIDLAVTLASLLGINAPAAATGRVLTEALTPSRHPGMPSPTPTGLTPPSGAPQ